jgi:serine/threonine protein kinase
MSADHTEFQSDDAIARAKDLSLQRTKPPADVPGYETQRFLGSGAYGEVWVGVDQTTGRRVAIKFYTHGSQIDWSLLSREVEKLAVLSADRYVVQLLDVGWDATPPYYVMDYIENGSLEDALVERGHYPASEAVELFEEVANGLRHLHSKGVLHCDLKPANVLLDEDEKPRLADFGQSRLSHEQAPALGTLFYMAPDNSTASDAG